MAELAPIELERAMRTCAIHQDPIHMITKDNIKLFDHKSAVSSYKFNKLHALNQLAH